MLMWIVGAYLLIGVIYAAIGAFSDDNWILPRYHWVWILIALTWPYWLYKYLT